MSENLSDQTGIEDSSEQFVDPEVQKHFEAISHDLPLYEQYYKELDEMAKSLATRLDDHSLPADRRESLEANKGLVDSEMLAVFESIKNFKSERTAISEEENKVHDFINNWRRKIGIQTEDEATQPSDGGNPPEAVEDTENT